MLRVKELLLFFVGSLLAENYYVDYQAGSDTQSGLNPESAWKHAPGDINATGLPSTVLLNPGDSVFLKGGVSYFGGITLNSSGVEKTPIVFKGNAWPGLENVKAIIDGSTPLEGWESVGENLFELNLPAEIEIGRAAAALNLHRKSPFSAEDDFLWPSQSPNPPDRFFYDDYNYFTPVTQSNLSRTSLRDTLQFVQADSNYWTSSSLLLWINPNRVVRREINRYDPNTATVYFDSLAETALYPDGRDQSYAIHNSPHTLNEEGEYYVDYGTGKILLYSEASIENLGVVSMTSSSFGINTNGQSHVVIEGFSVQKQAGEGLFDGMGIGDYSNAEMANTGLKIRNNEVKHNSHPDRGYGAIYLRNARESIVENNEVSFNYRQRGIFCTGCHRTILRGNTVRRSGNTSLSFYGATESQITGNTVLESKGGHANGITVYIASKDILIAGNKIIDCASPLTLQDGGNIYVMNNLIDSKGTEANISEWGRTSRGPWASGEMVFVNNTLVGNSRHLALNIGSSIEDLVLADSTVLGNTYVAYNNLTDGATIGYGDYSHNLYLGLGWQQAERYGWALGEGESEVREELVFLDPQNEGWSLHPESPGINAGREVLSLIPRELFPEYDFERDIDGNPRWGVWDVGAYEHQGTVAIKNPLQSEGEKLLRLYDLAGRLVYVGPRKPNEFLGLPAGIYLKKSSYQSVRFLVH